MGKLLNAFGIVLFAVLTSTALADNDQRELNGLLKGKYRFTFNQTCTYSSQGFSAAPPGGDVNGFAQSGEDYIDGIIKFHGNGTVTVTENGIYQNQGGSFPGSFPITTYQDICDGTYEVKRDLSFSYELACTVNFLTGFNVLVLKTLSIAGIKTQGQFDRSGESFIGSNVSGVVQTMNFSDGSTNFRVCGFHINGIKMP